jgi:hypothetical protein
MANDTTLASVFEYAQQGAVAPGQAAEVPTVFATFVEHFPNSHPPGSSEQSADLVTYGNGPLALSVDQRTLSGEFKLWRNAFTPGAPGFFEMLGTSPDVFDDVNGHLTVAITVSVSGKVTHQRKLKGEPVAGLPPATMAATYENALFVEKSRHGVRSLSFTLGTIGRASAT